MVTLTDFNPASQLKLIWTKKISTALRSTYSRAMLCTEKKIYPLTSQCLNLETCGFMNKTECASAC